MANVAYVFVHGLNYLGWVYRNGIGVEKDERKSFEWFTKSAKQGNAYGLSSLAWTLATSHDPSMRNGKEAVKLAQEAIQISAKPDSYLISVLAAAYAEQGDFEMAVTTQEKAISILTDKSREKESQAELNVYKDKKPWRRQESLIPQSSTNPQQNP